MNKVCTLTVMLLRLAVAEKVVAMFFVVGALAMLIVNMTYMEGLRNLWQQYDIQISPEHVPYVVGSFFSIVCVVLIGSSSYWWVLKEFFRDEHIHLYLIKPVSSMKIGMALLLSGILLMGLFSLIVQSVFMAIAFIHTRTIPVRFVLTNALVVWYVGSVCFAYFCYFFSVWKNPVSIILTLLLASAGFMSHRVDSFQAGNEFMLLSLRIGQWLIPPIDRLWTIGAGEYSGNVLDVVVRSVPLWFGIYGLAWFVLIKSYESKRQK